MSNLQDRRSENYHDLKLHLNENEEIKAECDWFCNDCNKSQFSRNLSVNPKTGAIRVSHRCVGRYRKQRVIDQHYPAAQCLHPEGSINHDACVESNSSVYYVVQKNERQQYIDEINEANDDDEEVSMKIISMKLI